MIPDSFGAVLAFLGLVAPGVVFQGLRRRRRTTSTRTTFEEASQTALTSFIFTVAGVGVVLLASLFLPNWFVDVHAWAISKSVYVASKPLLVAWTLLAVVGAACGLAALTEFLSARGAIATITSDLLWPLVLRRDVPLGSQPWLHIKMKDETEFRGYLYGYSTSANPEERDLSLRGPKLSVQKKGQDHIKELPKWECVLLRASDVAWMSVAYVPSKPSS